MYPRLKPITLTATMIGLFFFFGFYAFMDSFKKQKIKQNEKSLKVLYTFYTFALISFLGYYISGLYKFIKDDKYKYVVLFLLFGLQFCFAISILLVYKDKNKENKGRIASFVFIILTIILTIVYLIQILQTWKHKDLEP